MITFLIYFYSALSNFFIILLSSLISMRDGIVTLNQKKYNLRKLHCQPQRLNPNGLQSSSLCCDIGYCTIFLMFVHYVQTKGESTRYSMKMIPIQPFVYLHVQTYFLTRFTNENRLPQLISKSVDAGYTLLISQTITYISLSRYMLCI